MELRSVTGFLTERESLVAFCCIANHNRSKSVLTSIQDRIDHRQYNGASLLGLRGIVVKSHGGADVLGFKYALQEAMAEIKHRVPERIGEQVSSILTKEQVA